jgi:hypothetical protein
MEKRRDAWLRFNAPAIALPAYIDCSTPDGSLCPSPTRRSSVQYPEPTLANPLNLLQARTPKTLRRISPASPMVLSSRQASQPSISSRPGWKGWTEVAYDYVPSGTSLVSDITIRTARTRSEHVQTVVETVITPIVQRRSSRRVSGRKP